ncbi:MAG: fibronectin type III domain-containing protein [Nitrospirota bacterium]
MDQSHAITNNKLSRIFFHTFLYTIFALLGPFWLDVSWAAAPIAPTTLTATPVSYSQINLTWQDNSTDETGFKVERATSATGSYTTIATLGANVTSYSSTGLTQNKAYYYRVRAYIGTTYSAYTNVVTATTQGYPAPTNLIVSAVTSSRIDLTWQDNAIDESGYKVERATSAGGTYSVIATLGANITTYSDTGRIQNTMYYYRIRAYKSTIYSAYTPVTSATTPILAAPTNLTTDVASASQINLSWTDISYETRYDISRATSAGGTYSSLGSVNADVTTFQNTGLTVGKTYYYRVRAYDGKNYSAYSSVTNQTIRTITVSAGVNGSISPTGTVAVASGSNRTFTITPNTGYSISNVLVDNVSVGAVSTYTFTNVTANHTISATFTATGSSYTITAAAGPNGTIAPTGAINVISGATATFTITPNTGYGIASVLVDGTSVGTVITYSFANVTANHTISASFADTIAPTGTITINNNATITNNASVTLTLNATDTGSGVSQMQFSNDGTTWSTAEAYATTKTWMLAAGDGTKTVSVKYKDTAGTWSSAYHATITLDTTAPTVTITSPQAGTTSNNTPLLTYTVSDGTVIVKVDGVVVNKVSGNTLDTLIEGQHTITVQSTDAAGNTGTASVTITVNSGQPTSVGGRISADTTWTLANSPYLVTSTVQVYGTATTPVTLTIEPGVVVKFNSGSGLQIGDSTNQGALIAQGTSGNRITFTRNGTTGTWAGITFYDGTVDSTTALEYCDLSYSTGLSINSASPAIRNSTITDVNRYVSLSNSNSLFENVTISVANTTSGTYGMYLNSSNPTITGGSLTNLYTAGNGVYGSGSPVISNYSVSIVNTAGKYGMYLNSASSALSITNSTIGNGLFIGSTNITPTITGNTFSNADNSPIHAGANIIASIMNNNTVTGMTSAGKIEIVGEQIKQDTQWKKWAAPYVVTSGYIYVYKDTTTASTLTIDPGVTIKFNTSTALQVGSGSTKGILVAKGTSSNRILFTSNQVTSTPGSWYGIKFSGDAASSSSLEHATIEYAGTGGGYSNANLTLSSSSPVIKNCLIRNSAGSGIYSSSALSLPTIRDSEITGNKWGVYATNSNLTIKNTKIYSNPTYGVYNASTTIDVDARDNYWGASTGPTYSGNSQGTGDKINDHVLYNPWLGQAPGATLTINDAKVLPASLNPVGDYVTFTATISSSATWTITITDTNNITVKSFTGTGTSINQKWYGENASAVKVNDGAYYYSISAKDSSGNTASSPQGMIMVSRQIPIAILNPPTDNQIFPCGSTINITGTAADSTDFKNYSLDYGTGENPTAWTNLKTATTAVTNALLSAWNTSALTGTLYTVKLTVTDNAGNIATETSRVRLLCIQNPAVSEPYISPNANGVKDTTTISSTFSYPSNWTITLKNSSSTTVRTYTGTGTAMNQVWDGKNTSGTVVPNGTYSYQIAAVSSETTTVAAPAKTGTIIVDVTNPTAQITAPATNAVLKDAVPVTGTASDTNIDTYKVEYGPASGSGPWNLISSATTSVTSSTLATWVTNDSTNAVLVPNGSYLLKLTVTDKAGNISTTSVPVSTNNLTISNVGISSKTINTANSEMSTISFTVSSQATVTFKIIPEKQGPAGTPIYQTAKTCAAGACSFTWNGKNNTGMVVPDEAYLLILAASDGAKTDTYSPLQPTGTGTVSCSQSTGLDPVKNIPLVVTYNPTQASRVNINISWGSQNFKIQDAVAAAPGSHTYTWDGRNPSNKLLDVGAQSSCTIASLIRENHIITTGDTISATDIKTDPYAMQLAYGHLTKIKYTLPRNANVTVKLTSPSGTVITLVSNQLQTAGQPETTWNGMDTSDTTGKKTLVTEEGDYMVTIQAVNPVTGTSSITKGNLRIGY